MTVEAVGKGLSNGGSNVTTDVEVVEHPVVVVETVLETTVTVTL